MPMSTLNHREGRTPDMAEIYHCICGIQADKLENNRVEGSISAISCKYVAHTKSFLLSPVPHFFSFSLVNFCLKLFNNPFCPRFIFVPELKTFEAAASVTCTQTTELDRGDDELTRTRSKWSWWSFRNFSQSISF